MPCKTMKSFEETVDELRIGGFSLIQPKDGYRFSLDAPLLAALTPLCGVTTLLDLGCGGGVLPLLFLGKRPDLQVTGIERMAQPFAYAEKNRRYNRVDFELVFGDAMEAAKLFSSQRFDLVVSNPPYYKINSGRLPQNEVIAAAKTEVFWDQSLMMQQAFDLLRKGGRFSLIFDGRRGDEMVARAEAVGFITEKRLDIFMKAGMRGANRVYLQFLKGNTALRERDTLCMYDENGEMTPKMKRIWNKYYGTGVVSCGDSHR